MQLSVLCCIIALGLHARMASAFTHVHLLAHSRFPSRFPLATASVHSHHKLQHHKWPLLRLQAKQGDLLGDEGVVKRVLVYGDESMKQALDNDVVHLTLSGVAQHPDGTKTTICNRARSTVKLGNRRLPLGLEVCIKSMFTGEECEAQLSPKYSGPLVTPNYTLPSDTGTTWQIHLREVDINPIREFGSAAKQNGRAQEQDLRTFRDPLETLTATNRNPDGRPIKREMYNPAVHRIDPNQRVDGIAADESYRWQETPQKLEVFIPIPSELKAKDVNVTITGREIHVHRRDANNTVLLEGQLHDYVIASQCAWTIAGDADGARSEVYIFLQKGPAAQELWGTVLFNPNQRGEGSDLGPPNDHLQESNKNEWFPALPSSRYPAQEETDAAAKSRAMASETSRAAPSLDGATPDVAVGCDLFGSSSMPVTEEDLKRAQRIRVGFDERPNETGRSKIVIRTEDGTEHIGNDNEFGIRTAFSD